MHNDHFSNMLIELAQYNQIKNSIRMNTAVIGWIAEPKTAKLVQPSGHDKYFKEKLFEELLSAEYLEDNLESPFQKQNQPACEIAIRHS